MSFSCQSVTTFDQCQRLVWSQSRTDTWINVATPLLWDPREGHIKTVTTWGFSGPNCTEDIWAKLGQDNEAVLCKLQGLDSGTKVPLFSLSQAKPTIPTPSTSRSHKGGNKQRTYFGLRPLLKENYAVLLYIARLIEEERDILFHNKGMFWPLYSKVHHAFQWCHCFRIILISSVNTESLKIQIKQLKVSYLLNRYLIHYMMYVMKNTRPRIVLRWSGSC